MVQRSEWLLRGTLEFILRYPLLFWTCVITNLLGFILGGIFWYGPMMFWWPPWIWPFIPDCPLAALLGSIALIGIRARQRWGFFYALTAFACIKYGIWTLVFWAREWSLSGVIAPIEVMLFITHIGLFIEGLLFVPYIGPLSLPKRLTVIGWFVLSIYVDYGIGAHPPMGEAYSSFVTPTFAGWLAASLTALLGVGLLLLPYRERQYAPRVTSTPTIGVSE